MLDCEAKGSSWHELSASDVALKSPGMTAFPFLPFPAPAPGVFTGLPFGTGHSAFPTIARLANGPFVLMWREGSAHISSDGRIMRSVSDPDGQNWSAPQQVIVDNGPGDPDARCGPSGLSVIDGEMWLTYFVWANGAPSGARVARSADNGETFGPSVRIDPGLPWAAISGPVVQTPNGRLWTGFYGRKVGESVDSAYAAWSIDGGASWQTVRIAIGGPGNAQQEPWAVVSGSTVVFVFRDGQTTLGSRSVPETGSPWSPLHQDVVPNASGNPGMCRASNGKLYLVYRQATTRHAALASSADLGVSWTVERTLLERPETATSSIGMTYAHPIEPAPGWLMVPVGMERTNSDSRLYIGYV